MASSRVMPSSLRGSSGCDSFSGLTVDRIPTGRIEPGPRPSGGPSTASRLGDGTLQRLRHLQMVRDGWQQLVDQVAQSWIKTTVASVDQPIGDMLMAVDHGAGVLAIECRSLQLPKPGQGLGSLVLRHVRVLPGERPFPGRGAQGLGPALVLEPLVVQRHQLAPQSIEVDE